MMLGGVGYQAGLDEARRKRVIAGFDSRMQP